MIHLNLIKVADTATTSSVQTLHVFKAEPKSKGKKTILVAALAAVVALVVFVCSMMVFGLPKFLDGVFPPELLSALGIEAPQQVSLAPDGKGRLTTAGGTIAEQRAAEEAAARTRANQTIPSMVADIKPVAPEKRTSYEKYLPLEKVQYQKATLGQFLAFVQTATPENVGFSDLVYEAPNFYYVRGAAETPVSQRAFVERLKTVSEEIKMPPIPENAPATDITAFGKLKMEHVNIVPPVAEFVMADSLESELKKWKAFDASGKMKFNGLNKPTIEDFGMYKRYSYKVKTIADFVQIHAFVSAWKAAPARIGVPRAVLERSGKSVAATFSIDVFVK